MGSKSEPKSFRCSTASWAKPAVLCGDDVNKSIAIKYAAWRCLRKAIDNATAASHVSVSWLLLLLLRSAFGHSSAQAQQRMETKLPAWQADFETNSTESNRIGRLHGFEMISQCARGGQFRLSSADSIHSRFIRIEWNQSNRINRIIRSPPAFEPLLGQVTAHARPAPVPEQRVNVPTNQAQTIVHPGESL